MRGGERRAAIPFVVASLGATDTNLSAILMRGQGVIENETGESVSMSNPTALSLDVVIFAQ